MEAIESTAKPAPEVERLVCFRIRGQEYGVRIDAVRETLVVRPITRVFLTPPWVLGIVNVRGDIVPVLDLAQLMGMAPLPISGDSRIIVLEQGGRCAGIVVDELGELRRADAADLAPPPGTLDDDVAELLAGMITAADGAAVRVLDHGALFTCERMTALARAGIESRE